MRSNIKEKGRYKVIDKISVDLNDKTDVYEAKFSNLGIKKVLVDSGTVKTHPKLLVSGVWCIADLEYEFTEDKNASPWILSTLKPIQLSHFDFDGYVEARKQVHHRRVDRPADPEHRLQPGDVRQAQQADSSWSA